MPHTNAVTIDAELVRALICTQFPQWANLPIQPIEHSGWDNRTFYLGEHMSVRMPSGAQYAAQVEKEQYWLPKLAPLLPLKISTPLAMGVPARGYPWHWSVYQWLEGHTASRERIPNLRQFAVDLAKFLHALHQIDTTAGPVAGQHKFYRGGSLHTYDAEARQAIAMLGDKIDNDIVNAIWNAALASTWEKASV